MSRKLFVLSITVMIAFVFITPALAITVGQPDGDAHPEVGSMVLRVPNDGLYQICTGTLISENVFLTASHCTAWLDNYLADHPDYEILVTFDPTIHESGKFYTGIWHTNPEYPGPASDPGDVAVIVLDQAPGIVPARLPEAGLLDELKDEGVLKDKLFTAVGYGSVRDSNRKGFQGIYADNLNRNRVDQEFLSLTNAWITLSMNLATGNGGTCYGDSGGPHFIHLDGVETDIVAAITITGDAVCKATDKDYRMDSESARRFLGDFVELP